jgi:hypothetical protein
VVSAPTAINLYPVAETPENPPRLFIAVTAVGSVAASLPLAFDTGSAGITINALQILPPNMVTPDGFVFAPGQSTLVYQGIMVTNQQGTRAYGGSSGRTELGNIAYAAVTFGDASGTLITRVMPVFLYYAVQLTDTGQEASAQQQQGWFGVNDKPDSIDIAGSEEPANGFPACSFGVTGTCYVVSVLKYLEYSSGITPGFLLQGQSLQECDISAAGSCVGVPMLTVGLTSALLAGFTTTNLNCIWTSAQYGGPQDIQGYPVCHPDIAGVTISADGDSFAGPVLFDTGTPNIDVNVPPKTNFPDPVTAGAPVTFTTPGGFQYTVTAGSGIDEVNVTTDSNSGSIIGIPYFTSNSFFIDFASSTEGWK